MNGGNHCIKLCYRIHISVGGSLNNFRLIWTMRSRRPLINRNRMIISHDILYPVIVERQDWICCPLMFFCWIILQSRSWSWYKLDWNWTIKLIFPSYVGMKQQLQFTGFNQNPIFYDCVINFETKRCNTTEWFQRFHSNSIFRIKPFPWNPFRRVFHPYL